MLDPKENKGTKLERKEKVREGECRKKRRQERRRRPSMNVCREREKRFVVARIKGEDEMRWREKHTKETLSG